MKTYIGIDPGVNGYIAAYIDGDDPYIETHAIPRVGKSLDINELNKIIRFLSSIGDSTYCVIEDVHAIFGSAASATFSFGYICGVKEALLVANNISYSKVAPKKWQKDMWEGIPKQTKLSKSGKKVMTDTKAMSLLACKRIFPDIDLRDTTRCSKPHDGKVDALLIMDYARRNF